MVSNFLLELVDIMSALPAVHQLRATILNLGQVNVSHQSGILDSSTHKNLAPRRNHARVTPPLEQSGLRDVPGACAHRYESLAIDSASLGDQVPVQVARPAREVSWES